MRLNPCCNGRWSRTHFSMTMPQLVRAVLILVVMEDGLVLALRQVSMGAAAVLILVVMEDGLVLALRQVSMGAAAVS